MNCDLWLFVLLLVFNQVYCVSVVCFFVCFVFFFSFYFFLLQQYKIVFVDQFGFVDVVQVGFDFVIGCVQDFVCFGGVVVDQFVCDFGVVWVQVIYEFVVFEFVGDIVYFDWQQVFVVMGQCVYGICIEYQFVV